MSSLLNRLAQIADDLSANQAKVGWFPTSVYPNGTPVAYVAIIQELGEPSKNIPPRPFIRKAIADNQKLWCQQVGEAVKNAINSGLSGEEILELAGLKIQGDIRKALTEVTAPALSPKTLKARQRRGNSSTKPLNDTGHLLATLTSTVEAKE